MKTNIGTADRIIRLFIGAAIIVLGIVFHSWLGIIGVIPIFTAASGWCWLYTLLGISTRHSKSPQQQSSTAA